MSESGDLLSHKCMKFAIRIVKLYKWLCDEKKEFVMSKQLLRSGTSIGAKKHKVAKQHYQGYHNAHGAHIKAKAHQKHFVKVILPSVKGVKGKHHTH